LASLVLTIVGALIALGGLVTLIPLVRARQLSSGAMGAWIFRAGILILLVGEALAVFNRPEAIIYKTMLILSAAIVFVTLAMLFQEWQQPGFILANSFSWGAGILGMSALILAMTFVDGWFMLGLTVASLLAVRYFNHRTRTQAIDPGSLQSIIIGAQATIVVITVIALFV
jgi:hypothetical protein